MKQFLNTFDAIMYINRAKDGERNIHIQNTFGNMGVPLHRVDAVVPQSTDLTGIIQFNITRHDGEPYHIKETTPQRLKEVCCSFSHARAWEQAYANGYKNVLIIEDDVLMRIKDDEKLMEFVNNKPSDNHITYYNYLLFGKDCGSWLTERGYYIDIYSRNKFWYRAESGVFSTSAYAVNFDNFTREQYNDVISQLTQGVIADFFFSSYIQSNFNCYIPYKRLMECSEKFDSTIGDNYKGIKEAYRISSAYEMNYIWGDLFDSGKFENNKYNKRTKNSSDETFVTICVGDVYRDYKVHKEYDISEIGSVINDLDLPIKIFETEYNSETTENGKYPNRGKKTYLYTQDGKGTMKLEKIYYTIGCIIEKILDN